MGFIHELFAYPYGETSLEVINILKEFNISHAFGQHSGVISIYDNKYYLPRFSLNEQFGDIDRFIFAAESFPIVITDDIENVSNTKKMLDVLNNLNVFQDVKRLENRKRRSGKVVLRGRASKIGKSVLFVVSNSEKISKACSGIPGVDSCSAKDLSVLNLAPGGTLIRLTVFSKKAIEEISHIKSNHLELMVTLQ